MLAINYIITLYDRYILTRELSHSRDAQGGCDQTDYQQSQVDHYEAAVEAYRETQSLNKSAEELLD